jgi:nitroreductase
MNAPTTPARIPDHPVDPLFPARWSPRAFAADTITEAELLTLFEAARWAPSSMNVQPWRFVWGLRGDDGFAAIADALLPFNRDWAQHAAALVAIASRTTRATADQGEVPNGSHAFDAGAAWAHLALQAHLGGWVTHAMGGFDAAKAAASLHLPAGHALHAVVAIGRQGDPAMLPEALRAREAPNGRMPVADFARHASFGA